MALDNLLPWGDSLMNPFGIRTVSPDKTRRRIWQQIKRCIGQSYNNQLQSEVEAEQITQLAEGMRWLDMIPTEWKDIYGALFDENQEFKIDEREKTNIEKDVHRTFGVFTRNRLLQLQFRLRMPKYDESLKVVLLAAAHQRKYTQGFNFLAALFILHDNDEKDSFILLCFLLKQRHLEVLFDSRYSSLLEYMKVFEKRLRRNNRTVYSHFKSIGFEPICYAIEWFTTCFIVSSPGSGELSSCVIDMLLLGFTDAMLRVGLAVLDLLEPFILELELEVLQVQFKTLTRQLDPIQVIARALTLDIGHGPTTRGPIGGSSTAQGGGALSAAAAVAAATTADLLGAVSAIGNFGSSPPSQPSSSSVKSRAIKGFRPKQVPSSSSSSSSSSTAATTTMTTTTTTMRGDILESMALNIEKMSPTPKGEFLDTMLDPLIGIDDEASDSAPESSLQDDFGREQREEWSYRVAMPSRRKGGSKSRRAGKTGGGPPRHGEDDDDDGDDGHDADEDVEYSLSLSSDSSISDWPSELNSGKTSPTAPLNSSPTSSAIPSPLPPDAQQAPTASPPSSSTTGPALVTISPAALNSSSEANKPRSPPRSPNPWLDGLVTVLSLGSIRSATKTSPGSERAGGGQSAQPLTGQTVTAPLPAPPVTDQRPSPLHDPSPTSSDFCDADNFVGQASSAVHDDAFPGSDWTASSCTSPRKLTQYLSEQDRATERYRRNLSYVVSHLQTKGKTGTGLSEEDTVLLQRSLDALVGLGGPSSRSLSSDGDV